MYNKRLNTLFPVDSDFVVVPQYLPDSRNAADPIVMYEILLQVNRPVFVLELKPPNHLENVRQRMTIGDAVSALGTRLCFYTLDTSNEDAAIVGE